MDGDSGDDDCLCSIEVDSDSRDDELLCSVEVNGASGEYGSVDQQKKQQSISLTQQTYSVRIACTDAYQ